jgi:hypothetical protein
MWYPEAEMLRCLVEGKVKTKLKISTDNKILTGIINLELVTKEATTIGGFITISRQVINLADECDFKGTKSLISFQIK